MVAGCDVGPGAGTAAWRGCCAVLCCGEGPEGGTVGAAATQEQTGEWWAVQEWHWLGGRGDAAPNGVRVRHSCGTVIAAVW